MYLKIAGVSAHNHKLYIIAPDGEGTDGVLRQGIADAQPAIGEVTGQQLPLVEGVGHGLVGEAVLRHPAGVFHEPRLEVLEDRGGQLFVFINRKRTQLKVLYFEQGGYCLWSKRLEAGRFHFNASGGDKQALSWTDLKLIIEGIDLRSVRRFKRYRRGHQRAETV